MIKVYSMTLIIHALLVLIAIKLVMLLDNRFPIIGYMIILQGGNYTYNPLHILVFLMILIISLNWWTSALIAFGLFSLAVIVIIGNLWWVGFSEIIKLWQTTPDVPWYLMLVVSVLFIASLYLITCIIYNTSRSVVGQVLGEGR